MPRANSNALQYNMAQLFGHSPSPAPLPTVTFNYRDQELLTGVEVEAEGADDARSVISQLGSSSYWKMVNDGSLRNGIEFVLKTPLRGNALAGAIRQFFDVVEDNPIVANARTSCHIHVEMRDVNVDVLRGTILAYQAAEHGFWKATHTQRRWTGYCLPLMEAQGAVVAKVMKESTELGDISNSIREANRYSSFNLMSLARHGSVEFRHFYNPTSEEQLNKWINLCHAVKILGKKIAEAAAHDDESVLEWAENSVEVIADWVIADPSLGEFATIADRGVSIEALEKLLAVVEVEHLSNPVGVPTPRAASTRAPAYRPSRVVDAPEPWVDMREDGSESTAARTRDTFAADRTPSFGNAYPGVPGDSHEPADIDWLGLTTAQRDAARLAWTRYIDPLVRVSNSHTASGISTYLLENILSSTSWPTQSCPVGVRRTTINTLNLFVTDTNVEALISGILQLRHALNQVFNPSVWEDDEVSDVTANQWLSYINNALARLHRHIDNQTASLSVRPTGTPARVNTNAWLTISPSDMESYWMNATTAPAASSGSAALVRFNSAVAGATFDPSDRP